MGSRIERTKKILKKNKFRVPARWCRRTGRPTAAGTPPLRRRKLQKEEHHRVLEHMKRENREHRGRRERKEM